MHALPQPKHPLTFGAIVFALALFLLAAAAPELGSLDLSFFGGGSAGGDAPVVTAEPTWTGDPMRSPLEALTR